MKLAIVIPYFRLAFFERTLASLAGQTDKRFRVYIGDDNSPNSPTEILERYNHQLDIVYKRFDNNFGCKSLVSQWHRCLELTSDESWVMLLGDDDVLDSDCIAAFYNHLKMIEAEPISVVRFATKLIDENNNPQSEIYQHPVHEKSTDFIYRKETGQTRSSLGEYIFERKKLFEKKFVDFPLAWHADDMAILQCSNFGMIYSINDAVVSIRVSNISISGDESNIEIKKKATFLFYSMLAFGYASQFTSVQRRKIIGKVEQYFYRHRSAALFLKIARWHMPYGIGETLKFVRRTLRN